ncbi:MAG: SDR family oxidoreductase [Candidatus Nanoarchaeia archaeon]
MKTILITGSSSGIGKVSVDYFSKRNWNVVATMRDPKKASKFNWPSNVFVLALDVTNLKSIQKAIKGAEKKFGNIDVLINNAGYGLFSPIECASEKQIKDQFETNVFGLVNVIKEVLPSMRERNKGVIINVSSILGRITVPGTGYYAGTKYALEAISEGLWYDLAKTRVKVKLIEPGAIKTQFASTKVIGEIPLEFYKKMLEEMKNEKDFGGSTALDVAKVIYKAVTDKNKKLRYPAGKRSTTFLLLRKFLPDQVALYFIKRAYGY